MEEKNVVTEIERIVTENQCKELTVFGRQLVFGSFKEVTEPYYTPETLTFTDLSSFAKIIIDEQQSLHAPLYVQIKDENTIICFSKLDNKMRRLIPYSAKYNQPFFAFEQFQGYENFVIGLRSKFEPTAERDELIKMISSISNVEENNITDNGVSQTATYKKGSLIQTGEVKAIVKLKPYRYFNEVEQAESEFLFRISKEGDRFALFEADGSRWKIDAKLKVKAFLEERFADVNIVVLI